MVWLPDGEKNRRYLYSFWHNARTWQTQTHTETDSAWQHRPHLCIASRGKNLPAVGLSPRPHWRTYSTLPDLLAGGKGGLLLPLQEPQRPLLALELAASIGAWKFFRTSSCATDDYQHVVMCSCSIKWHYYQWPWGPSDTEGHFSYFKHLFIQHLAKIVCVCWKYCAPVFYMMLSMFYLR